jgi:hypothetical protein
MPMNYIEISGSPYNLGYQTGRWWAEYFLRNRKVEAVKAFLRWCNYIDYFQHSWDSKNEIHAPLLRNTMQWYPEIIEEIAGIEKGVSDAFHDHKTKVNVSFLDMFCLMLGETDDGDYNCSSAVFRTPAGYLLAHNDEYLARYPVLVAKVAMKTTGSVRRFISVSYPFQLLGSSAGTNGFLAFSGNTIGCKAQVAALRATWACRVPLAIFPRKLLEATSIKEVKDLFSKHHITLPSHHYVIFRNQAYSLQIRPLLRPSSDPGNQIRVIKIGGDVHCHTNHFLTDKGYDKKWAYYKPGERESLRRHQYLSDALKHQDVCDELHIKKVFLDMAQHSRYRQQTAASLFFKVAAKQSSLEGHFYFASGFRKSVFIHHDRHASTARKVKTYKRKTYENATT